MSDVVQLTQRIHDAREADALDAAAVRLEGAS